MKQLARRVVFAVPRELSSNFREASPAGLEELTGSLQKNYFTGWRSSEKQGPARYEADLANHLHRRLQYDRTRIVPWLSRARPLAGAHVLEIGCGTGSSTVALGEQGAAVTAVDVEEGSLAVARDRCRIHGVEAHFVVANAVELHRQVDVSAMDMLIFFACLEHMTIEERLSSLRTLWGAMRPGALLVVIETPNRLWFFDQHTAQLPFFHWLPDALAFQYSRFSPRNNFREIYTEPSDETMLHFLRRGRGMSFHEFDLTLGDVRRLDIVSCLSTEDLIGKWKFSSMDRAYMRFLARACGEGVNEAFLFPNLNLIIRKS